MTEAEWRTVNQPRELLRQVRAGSARKHRCAACGYAGLVWPLLGEFGCHALEIAAQYVNDEVSDATAKDMRARLEAANTGHGYNSPYTPVIEALRCGAPDSVDPPWLHTARAAENIIGILGYTPVPLGDIVRDVFGNPFRPCAFAPEWRTDTAVAIARGMHESRDFGAMPILADALQDAGCDTTAILNHCREEGATHVRGCWVCDLVLGKS